MIQYFLFNDFTLEKLKDMNNLETKDKIAFFICAQDLEDNKEFILNSNFDYIVYDKNNKLSEINKIRNQYIKRKNRNLLKINTILKIKDINDFNIYTNFEYNNHNDGIYKSSNYVNHKFCKMLKEKNKFYFIDLNLLSEALKENDSKIILRIKETIKNLYKNRIYFIITDTSKRNYLKNNYIDLLYYLGIKDKSYSKKMLEYDFFKIDRTLNFK